MGKARELKFRVWDNENDCFFEPTFEGHRGKIEELMLNLGGDLCLRTIDRMIHESMFKDRFVVNQFTGLQDKNGVDIYEGDIIENEFGKKTVKFESGSYMAYESVLPIYMSHLDYSKIEVIGNIHENPELLNN